MQSLPERELKVILENLVWNKVREECKQELEGKLKLRSNVEKKIEGSFSVTIKPNDGYYLYNSPFQRRTLRLRRILDTHAQQM